MNATPITQCQTWSWSITTHCVGRVRTNNTIITILNFWPFKYLQNIQCEVLIQTYSLTHSQTREILTAGALQRWGEWDWTTIPRGDPGCLFLHKELRELWDIYGRSLLIKVSLFPWNFPPLPIPFSIFLFIHISCWMHSGMALMEIS